ncbi:MAG: MFS transporter [Deltaproteobacteria bacterium]|nr:MAG: MFS transporter [Deltaproteobacteria bacterium]
MLPDRQENRQPNENPTKSWRVAFQALIDRRAVIMLFLGFSAGVPILLIFSTLSVWLREAGVQRSTITFFSWAALGYSFKFVWAPLVDRLPFPYLTNHLGRRRGWLLVSQLSLVFAILWTSFFDPQKTLIYTAIGALLIGFSSATQDIVIDAYRIESAEKEMQAILSATYIAGYRIGMIVAGAGALWLADWWGGENYDYLVWARVYRWMAALMLVGIMTTLAIKDPGIPGEEKSTFQGNADYIRFLFVFALAAAAFVLGFFLSVDMAQTLKSIFIDNYGMLGRLAGFLTETARLAFSIVMGAGVIWGMVRLRVVPYEHVRETYVDPIAEFLGRYGKTALVILALIGTYRISDILMGVITNVFYLDVGYSKTQIATYTKFWGLLATMGGGLLGGVLSIRFGIIRILFLGAFLSAASNVLFSYVAQQQPDEMLLLMVISADNLSAGIAAAAFVAYLSSLTCVAFTATQYAIFSSIMTLVPKILAGYSGSVVDSVGYELFFIGTAVVGVPVLLLIVWAGHISSAQE